MIESGNERLLIVDDTRELTAMMRQLLEPLGYLVTTSNCSREALALFGQDPMMWDLVITDLLMPGMSGLELAHQMLELNPVMPIILISGCLGERSLSEIRAAGINEMLDKPFSREDLIKAIRRALQKKKPMLPGERDE